MGSVPALRPELAGATIPRKLSLAIPQPGKDTLGMPYRIHLHLLSRHLGGAAPPHSRRNGARAHTRGNAHRPGSLKARAPCLEQGWFFPPPSLLAKQGSSKRSCFAKQVEPRALRSRWGWPSGLSCLVTPAFVPDLNIRAIRIADGDTRLGIKHDANFTRRNWDVLGLNFS